MADLDIKSSSQMVSITGADSSGTETYVVNATANGDLNVVDGLKSGGVYGNLSLTTANTAYEAKVGGSRLANRKLLTIIAFDNKMYWGYSNSVTTSNGFPLEKGQVISFSIDPNDTSFQVWLVSGTASKNARVTESP